jgi:hypothetical protein
MLFMLSFPNNNLPKGQIVTITDTCLPFKAHSISGNLMPF